MVTSCLTGAHVLGLETKLDSIGPFYKFYDKKYEVSVTYERLGKKKTILVPITIAKDRWVLPTESELKKLDGSAN